MEAINEGCESRLAGIGVVGTKPGLANEIERVGPPASGQATGDATPLVRALVGLPPFFSPGYFECFLNLPTLNRLGYVVEGIDNFGDPATAAVCAFNPQIPE
jgi:hypothetical protein